ncbi:unnamed protein product [Citrullus colocynthis]|uniref:Uncharacterized protein n=1 Tax=Citrullus colocynthis TaxID=252529 RepID=A0ABP0YJX6_9ROSI
MLVRRLSLQTKQKQKQTRIQRLKKCVRREVGIGEKRLEKKEGEEDAYRRAITAVASLILRYRSSLNRKHRRQSRRNLVSEEELQVDV